MKKLRKEFPIEKMSKVFGVTRSGYYSFISPNKGKRAQEEKRLTQEIEKIFYEHKKRYGSPRVFRELKEKGFSCSEKRVAKIMKKNMLVAKQRKKWKGKRLVVKEKKPNLLNQDFKAEKKNSKWVSDITYIRTSEGWAYLCAVMDLYSRKIIGHSIKRHMRKELVIQALEQAISRRGSVEGVIFHSDQGSQYGSEAIDKSLKKNNILGSMSGKGSCYDNAVMESFFNSLKRECIGSEIFKNIQTAEKKMFKYIECYYNNKRKHSSLGYLSPVKFEEKHEKSLC
jgi:transposase InsO family protein